MTNKLRKIVALVLVVLILTGTTAMQVWASDTDQISVSLRIEGVDETIYYNKDITIAAESSIADLMTKMQGLADAPEVIIGESWYVTSIGGLEEGAYGGWSGWLFRNNGSDLMTGIDQAFLADSDKVVCYYGDPYGGPGMQYPVPNTGRLFSDGVIAFTSLDTSYDENWTPVTEEKPVADASVLFNGLEYITDENGEIKITALAGISGFKPLQINRFDETSGVPTVLRFEPEYKLYVPFADTPAGSWYASAVMFCVGEWDYKGVDTAKNLFEPMRDTTMAELVTALARLSGEAGGAAAGGEAADSDAAGGDATAPWYEASLEWAVANGIVAEDGFNPSAAVTREEFIYMLYKTAEQTGDYDMSVSADISGAVDFSDITSDYRGAVSWAVASGIIIGSSETQLVIDPLQNLNRAMLCKMLYNCMLSA